MLTVAEVDRIAHLARLALSDVEKALYAQQLSAVLDYAAELATVDVEGIAPTASVLPARSVTRSGDVPGGSLPRHLALANAPKTDGASFVVPGALGDAGDLAG